MGPEPALYFKGLLVNSRTVFLFDFISKLYSFPQMTEKSFICLFFRNTVFTSSTHSSGKLLLFVTGKLPFVTESLFRVIKIKVLSTPPNVCLKIRSDFSRIDSEENSIEVAGSHQKCMF